MKSALSFVALSLSVLAIADDKKSEPFFSIIDFSVPHSAAQAMLGLDPSKVDSPTKLSTKAFSILRSIGSGSIQDGFSYSMALQEFGNRKLTAKEWRSTDPTFRISNYSQISIALVPGNGKDTPAKAAMGFAVPLLDDSDWMKDRKKVMIKAADKNGPAQSLDPAEQYVHQFDAVFEAFNTGVPEPLTNPAGRTAVQFAKYKEDLASKRDEVVSFEVSLASHYSKLMTKDTFAKLSDAIASYREACNKFLNTANAVGDVDIPALSVQVSQDSPIWKLRQDYVAYSDAYKTVGNLLITFNASKIDIKGISDNFNEQASSYYWNKTKLDIAIGSSWGSADNTYSGLVPTGTKAWLTLNVPLNSKDFIYEPDPKKFKAPTLSSLTIHASMTNNEKTFANAAFSAGQSGSELGLRFRSGGSRNSIFIEDFYKSSGPAGGKTNVNSWTLGVEQQADKARWIQFSIGSDKTKAKGIFLGLGYSFNLSSARELNFADKS